jgi:hypothetical protein
MSYSNYSTHLTIFLTKEQKEKVIQLLRDSNRFEYPASELICYETKTHLHPILVSYYIKIFNCCCRVSNDERRRFIRDHSKK